MDLEKNAIGILQTLCGNSGCVISDSGGKDSSVIKHLALKARQQYGLPFSVQHNHTTVDASLDEAVCYVSGGCGSTSNAGPSALSLLSPRSNVRAALGFFSACLGEPVIR